MSDVNWPLIQTHPRELLGRRSYSLIRSSEEDFLNFDCYCLSIALSLAGRGLRLHLLQALACSSPLHFLASDLECHSLLGMQHSALQK